MWLLRVSPAAAGASAAFCEQRTVARSSSSFPKGQSGNPGGRPKGTKNRKTILLQELEKDGSALACAIKAAALTGDTSAMSLWLTRLEPAVRVRGETIEMDLDVNASVEDQIKTVMQATVNGEISVDVGNALINNISKLAEIRTAANAGGQQQSLIDAFKEMARTGMGMPPPPEK
jgi:hypothetical protein